MHYNRSPQLMKRRADRAARGEDICGPGFEPNQTCVRVVQLKAGSLECKETGAVMKKVLTAKYGMLAQGQEHGRYPYCLEGADSVEVEPSCSVDVSKLIAEKCLGKEKCNVAAKESFGLPPDPCPGKFKHLQVVVECASHT